MRSIVRKEGGDTDTSRDYEYTDWNAVKQFAHDVVMLVDHADDVQRPHASDNH